MQKQHFRLLDFTCAWPSKRLVEKAEKMRLRLLENIATLCTHHKVNEVIPECFVKDNETHIGECNIA